MGKWKELEQWFEELHISNSASSNPKSGSTAENIVLSTSELTGLAIMKDEEGRPRHHKNWTKDELSIRDDLARTGIVSFTNGTTMTATGAFEELLN
jgi:hypothetical protein